MLKKKGLLPHDLIIRTIGKEIQARFCRVFREKMKAKEWPGIIETKLTAKISYIS
jgi:hypothetical protein